MEINDLSPETHVAPLTAANKTLLLNPGMVIARWRLIKRLGAAPGESVRWLCECQCGIQRTVLENNLRRRSTQSCGCHRQEKHLLEGVLAALRVEYRIYRNSARKFNRQFTLTEDEFRVLMLLSCTYCGKRPSRVIGRRRSKGSGEFYHQTAIVGGIDRMDSKGGYTPDNCTPACMTCNFEKGSMTVEEYIHYRFRRTGKVPKWLSSPHAVFHVPSA